ncbi:MAG: SRPBCC domain-containing protein [Ignavibacteriaceae bacterium]|nr:SRPBCC domain-containing protein [Ignavibacteriaceae bacterium]
MKAKIKLSVTLPAPPDVIYKAWLSSKEHTAFTGEKTKSTSRKGGSYTAGDGYMWGKNLELDPGKKIVQSWRSTDFPKDAEDSLLEILLEKSGKGTKLTLTHSGFPMEQFESYKEGWKEFYFVPMKKYFRSK